ncbi:MAG: hypothetical protein FWD57_15750, partial [Polyangiaceae bacterium]|nr:hypothetical protein [Polyangiaceae bacterium]
GERNLDRRVDIYSLGIMLFEMLAGRVPFEGTTTFTTMHKHVNEPIPPIAMVRPDVPEHVRWVIEKACAKNRDFRFGSASEMAAALRGQGFQQPGMAPGMPPAYPTNPSIQPIPPMMGHQRPSGQIGLANTVDLGLRKVQNAKIFSTISKNPLILLILLAPIIGFLVIVPIVIYKIGQPWCNSAETECGKTCCDNAAEACGDGGCYRRCLIDEINYPVGAENPSNNCQVCSDSTLFWEPQPEGTECGGGKFCTAQSLCVDGCTIGGKVYPQGTANPSNSCQLCLAANQIGWTSAPKGSPCDEGYGKNACDGSGKCGPVMSIGVGNDFTCGVTSAGAAKCWGVNDRGQLGNGTKKDSQSPVTVALLGSGVSAVVPFYRRACAITRSGQAWCWGNNEDRQLTSSGSDLLSPQLIWTNVRAIGGSYSATCAITESGSVVCKGAGFQLREKVFDENSDVVALTTGGLEDVCALLSTGTVKCWDKLGIPMERFGLPKDVISISGGLGHTCALGSTGSVRCWGWNDHSQVGSDRGGMINTPINVSGLTGGVKGIATLDTATCALMSGGSVKCWGNAKMGRIGPSYTANKSNPVDVSAVGSGSRAIASGTTHSCVITDTNSVKCWGFKYSYGGSKNSTGHFHHVWTVAGFP